MMLGFKVTGNGYLFKLYGIFMTLILMHVVSGEIIKSDFIVDYFKQKNVQHVVTFACWKESGKKKDFYNFSFFM